MQRVLRCCAEGRGGDWEAICLDLDVAVQGSSFEEVFESLNKAIGLYLKTVAELPEAERANLVERPAPLRLRLKFAFDVLRTIFRDDSGNDSCSHHYTVPCAA